MRALVWMFVGFACLPRSAAGFELGQAAGLRIHAIELTGAERMPPAAILEPLGLRSGARFDATRARRARADLLQRGDFERIDIRPRFAGPDSMVIAVHVRRKSSFEVAPRGGRAADGRLAAGGRMTARGEAGRGENLNAEIVHGGESILALAWEEPRPFARWSLGFRLGGRATRLPSPPEAGAHFERTEANLAILLPWRSARFELEAALAEVRASVPVARLVPERERERLRGLMLRWKHGTRDDAFTVRDGHVAVELAAWNGDAAWREGRIATGIRLPLGNRAVAAADFGLRLCEGVVPRSLRMHLGRERAPRALPAASASGDAAGVASFEVQWPVTFGDHALLRARLPVALHGFADGGMAWGASAPGARAEAERAGDARLRWSFGAGATAWLRPSLPCRLELGLGDDGAWRMRAGFGILGE
jgi:hypothetical protein